MILKATISILKRTVKRLKVRNSRKRKTVTGSSHRRSAPTSYKRRRSLRTRRGNDLPCACLKHVCFVHAHVLNAYADGFCTTVGNMPWTASAECLDGCFCPVALFRIPGIAHYCSKTTGRTTHLGERDDGHFSFLLSTMQMRRVSWRNVLEPTPAQNRLRGRKRKRAKGTKEASIYEIRGSSRPVIRRTF